MKRYRFALNVATLIILGLGTLGAFAQNNKVIKIYRNGQVIDQFKASEIDFIEVDEETPATGGAGGEINGHEYVDLGLPSGLKWATYNVGASSDSPTDYGDYFAWGETSTKDDYTRENSFTYGKTAADLKASGVLDPAGNLTAQYDVATVKWGAPWRMPTRAECKELVDNCTWTWVDDSGVKVCKVTGPNGNYIYLQPSGCRQLSLTFQLGEMADYWSSTFYFDMDTTDNAWYFTSTAGQDKGMTGMSSRIFGYPVRPVSSDK